MTEATFTRLFNWYGSCCSENPPGMCCFFLLHLVAASAWARLERFQYTVLCTPLTSINTVQGPKSQRKLKFVSFKIRNIYISEVCGYLFYLCFFTFPSSCRLRRLGKWSRAGYKGCELQGIINNSHLSLEPEIAWLLACGTFLWDK